MHVDEALWHEVLAEEGVLDERIKSAVSGVEQERERLMNARIQAATAVQTFDARIVKCNRILKAAGAMEAPSANGSSRRKRETKRAGAETMDAVLGALNQLPDGGTIRELAAAVGLNTSTVRNAVDTLREDNRIRATGKRPARHGVPPEVYKVMNNDG